MKLPNVVPITRLTDLALVGLALGSCGQPTTHNAAETVQAAPASEAPKTSIMIRTIAGVKNQEAFLVEPTRDVPLDQLADAVRETGYRCDLVTAFNQLEQNSEVLDVYKIDCGKRSYQVTMFDGRSHIKPWTGNIVGQ
jgi:hypothetical protein